MLIHLHRDMLVAAAAAGLLCSCGGSSTAGSGSSADDVSKYRQTWGKPYASTTCAEWKATMAPAQRFAAAADMLTGARNKGDGGTRLPPDSLISTFQSGVTNACAIDTMSITDVGAGLYLTERQRFRP
jgi:hypothetical protein